MDKPNKASEKQTDHNSQTATLSIPGPGDYALGSVRSRALARTLLERNGIGKPVFMIHFVERADEPMPVKPYEVREGHCVRLEFYYKHPPEK